MTRLQLSASPSRSISPKGISRIYCFRERWYRVPKCVVGIGGGGPIVTCWSLGLCILLGIHYCIQVVGSECIFSLMDSTLLCKASFLDWSLGCILNGPFPFSITYYIGIVTVWIWSSPSKAHALETWLPVNGLWEVSESWVSELINISPLMNLYHCDVTGK